jgi:hypothetical protein
MYSCQYQPVKISKIINQKEWHSPPNNKNIIKKAYYVKSQDFFQKFF